MESYPRLSIFSFPSYSVRGMSDYEFVTIWNFDAPLERVWEIIKHSESWSEWWKGSRGADRNRTRRNSRSTVCS